MARRRTALGAVLAVCVGLMVGGCIDYPPDGNELLEQPEVQEPGAEPAWVCAYAPTYDQDWHNDVLCSNGVDEDRPYLREWDAFVTEDEIMESAQEYEDGLNATQ